MKAIFLFIPRANHYFCYQNKNFAEVFLPASKLKTKPPEKHSKRGKTKKKRMSPEILAKFLASKQSSTDSFWKRLSDDLTTFSEQVSKKLVFEVEKEDFRLSADLIKQKLQAQMQAGGATFVAQTTKEPSKKPQTTITGSTNIGPAVVSAKFNPQKQTGEVNFELPL